MTKRDVLRTLNVLKTKAARLSQKNQEHGFPVSTIPLESIEHSIEDAIKELSDHNDQKPKIA